MDVVNNPEVDVVVELIGGYTIAKEVVLGAIANGKRGYGQQSLDSRTAKKFCRRKKPKA